MRHIPLLFIYLLAISTTFAQSPWVAEKGAGYAQLGYTTIGPYSDLYLNGSETYNLTREVTDKTIQIYTEYGIGSGTSVLFSLPVKSMQTGDEIINPSPSPNSAGSFTTLGNLQLALRHNFSNDKVVFSGQLMTELNTAGYDEGTGLRGGLNATSIVPSLSVGKGFSNFYTYISLGSALRTNSYSSDLRISAEAGYKVLNRTYIIGVLDVVENFENGDAIESSNQLQSGLYLNNQSFFAYGIKAILGLSDNLGLTGAFYGASSGNVVAKSPSLNFGIYYKW